MPSIYIVNSDHYTERMFKAYNWKIVNNTADANLIQFTGGDDVDPSYYGEEKHSETYSNPKRDALESHIYHQELGKPMAGICRGGQFLNVMNGGKMYQHVNNHSMRWHKVYEHDDEGRLEGELAWKVKGDHHQMMIPSKEAKLVLSACESTSRETATEKYIGYTEDIEALYYPKTNCFCYQPHPEWVDVDDPSCKLYFDYLNKYFGL